MAIVERVHIPHYVLLESANKLELSLKFYRKAKEATEHRNWFLANILLETLKDCTKTSVKETTNIGRYDLLRNTNSKAKLQGSEMQGQETNYSKL